MQTPRLGAPAALAVCFVLTLLKAVDTHRAHLDTFEVYSKLTGRHHGVRLYFQRGNQRRSS